VRTERDTEQALHERQQLRANLKAAAKATHRQLEQDAVSIEHAVAALAERMTALLATGEQLHRLGLQLGLTGRRVAELTGRRLAERYMLDRLAAMLPGSVGRLDKALRVPLKQTVGQLRTALEDVPE
jgi:hypothetical protein